MSSLALKIKGTVVVGSLFRRIHWDLICLMGFELDLYVSVPRI